jgi:hypothetical protein
MTEHSGSGSVRQPWQVDPYQLISWWDVEQFSAALFCQIAGHLGSLRLKMENKVLREFASPQILQTFNRQLNDASGNLDIAYRDETRDWIRLVEEECKAIGLEVTASMARELLKRLDGSVNLSEQYKAMEAIEATLRHEMNSRTFIYIPSERADYYGRDAAFGEDVERRFPSASFDIREAGNCLATERSTATVFHLMRVMESGLRSLAMRLGIPYAPSWESYLTQINDRVSVDWKKKGADWRKDEPFIRQRLAIF